MRDDRPVIVNESFLRQLHRRLIIGWIVAVMAIASVIALEFMSRRDFRRARLEVAQLQFEMSSITAEQRKVTESFVIAWQNQQSTADLLVSWGGYAKERAGLVKYNSENRPGELVGARANK